MTNDRLQQAFSRKCFIAFITGGDPSIADTRRFVKCLVDAGVGLIEIGIPFSDPIAEGPVIREASERALAGGATLDALLDMISGLREQDGVTIPLAVMTYLNPVHHFGYPEFFDRARAAGVDAVIIPDLPFEEHGELADIAASHDVALVSMIAPTSAMRVREIAAHAKGFIYLVSSMGVTGVRQDITTDIASIVADIRQVTDVPVAIGFGIATPGQVAELGGQADAVIVGSAIVKLIARDGSQADQAISEYVREMVAALPQGA